MIKRLRKELGKTVMYVNGDFHLRSYPVNKVFLCGGCPTIDYDDSMDEMEAKRLFDEAAIELYTRKLNEAKAQVEKYEALIRMVEGSK